MLNRPIYSRFFPKRYGFSFKQNDHSLLQLIVGSKGFVDGYKEPPRVSNHIIKPPFSIKTADGKSAKSCVIYRTKKSPASQTVATIAQNLPGPAPNNVLRFHSNRFTFGEVIAERVNTAKTRRKTSIVGGFEPNKEQQCHAMKQDVREMAVTRFSRINVSVRYRSRLQRCLELNMRV